METGYGRVSVPVKLLGIWNTYGWPDDEALREIAARGTVYVRRDAE